MFFTCSKALFVENSESGASSFDVNSGIIVPKTMAKEASINKTAKRCE
jgi:hypothetical protein